MAGRMSRAVEQALQHWRIATRQARTNSRLSGPNVYLIAARYKIAPSSLYRAIKNNT